MLGAIVSCSGKVYDCRYPQRTGYAEAGSIGRITYISNYYGQIILHVRFNKHCLAKLNSKAVSYILPTIK